jgi:hypothetical protein
MSRRRRRWARAPSSSRTKPVDKVAVDFEQLCFVCCVECGTKFRTRFTGSAERCADCNERASHETPKSE